MFHKSDFNEFMKFTISYKHKVHAVMLKYKTGKNSTI